MPAKTPSALPDRAELTPALVASAIRKARALPGFKRHVVADNDQSGLILVIGKRTAKWALKYRPRGFRPDGSRFEPTYFVIGDVAIFSPVAARAEVGILRSRIEKGENPTAERARERAEKAAGQAFVRTEAERRADMIAALIDADRKGSFVPEFSTLSGATLDQCAAAFKLYGNFGGVRAKSRAETLMHVRLALAEMDAGGTLPGDLKTVMVKSLANHHAASPATGRHRVGALNRLFGWLNENEVVAANPVAKVKRPPPPPKRTRVWTAAEVRGLWKSADGLSTAKRDYLRLLLLLPLRRQELADTRRTGIQVNGSRMELVIAAVDNKRNWTEFRVPIVTAAREIVERLLNAPGEPGDYLIPLSEDGSRMNSWRRFAEKIEKISGVGKFSFHDARRVFSSECGEHELGDFGLIDQMINHVGAASKPGASGHYNHARRADARAKLMGDWAALVLHAVDEGHWPRDKEHADNVVALNFGTAK
jgi:integrase